MPHGVDHDASGPTRDADDDRARARGARHPAAVHRVRRHDRAAQGRPDARRTRSRRIAPRRIPTCGSCSPGGDGWGADARTRRHRRERRRDARSCAPATSPTRSLAALFRQAAVVAYPSFEEGFGLPALEALACGAPLVTTTGSALDEVVGDAALPVPPGDADALAGAFARLLDDPRAARLRAAGPIRRRRVHLGARRRGARSRRTAGVARADRRVKALITGASGFVGPLPHRAPARVGDEVVASRRGTDTPRHHRPRCVHDAIFNGTARRRLPPRGVHARRRIVERSRRTSSRSTSKAPLNVLDARTRPRSARVSS